MNDWIQARAGEMRESIAAIEAIGRELTHAQLSWSPREGQWSIAQIIEHLRLTDAPCLEPISALLANPPRGDAPWKPTIMGRLITKAVLPETQRKTRAGKVHHPVAQPPAEVIGEYAEVRKRLLELLVQSAGVDLNRVKTRLPIKTPLRYNLGDAFLIMTRHTQRHLQQVQRLREHPEFP